MTGLASHECVPCKKGTPPLPVHEGQHHAIDGFTDSDFILAAKIDPLGKKEAPP